MNSDAMVSIFEARNHIFLEKAAKLLSDSEAVLSLGLGDIAGRTAYLAVFHAAQALIFERQNTTPKTHRGVHVRFVELVRTDVRFDPDLRSFLSQACKMKAVADYDTGPEAEVPIAEAAVALVTARRFIITLLRPFPEQSSREPK